MDPIANMLTSLRNASRAKKARVHMPHSNMKEAMLHVMKKYGFVRSVNVIKDGMRSLAVDLDPERTLEFEQVSKPGRRMYLAYKELKKVKNGLGISLLSTSKGILSNVEAFQQKLGGELICVIY